METRRGKLISTRWFGERFPKEFVLCLILSLTNKCDFGWILLEAGWYEALVPKCQPVFGLVMIHEIFTLINEKKKKKSVWCNGGGV